MSTISEAITLENQGAAALATSKLHEALTAYEQALTIREQMLGVKQTDLLDDLTIIAELYQTQADYQRAESLYRRIVALCEAAYGPNDWRTAKAVGDIAGILDEQGFSDQAGPLYEESAQLIEQKLGPDHHETALALAKLARYWRVIGDEAQAEQDFRRALAIYESQTQLQIEEQKQYAICLNNFAYLLNTLSRYIEAEVLLRKAIQIESTIPGADRLALAVCFKNLGRAFSAQNDRLLAKMLYQRALEIYQRTLGGNHPNTLAISQLLTAEKEAS